MFSNEKVWLLKAILKLVVILKGEKRVLLPDSKAVTQVEGDSGKCDGDCEKAGVKSGFG